MTLPRAVRAVILDMDGTLHDTERLYLAALHGAIASVGGNLSEAFAHSLIGLLGGEAGTASRAHLGADLPEDTMNRADGDAVRAASAASMPTKPGAAVLVSALARSSCPWRSRRRPAGAARPGTWSTVS